MGSPKPGFWGESDGDHRPRHHRRRVPAPRQSCTLGRERGEINFPTTATSRVCTRVSLRDGRVFLTDLGSSNGTFVKVNGERAIGHESFVPSASSRSA